MAELKVKTIDSQFLLVTIGKKRYTVVKVGNVSARKNSYWKVEDITKAKSVIKWLKEFKSCKDAIDAIKYINYEDYK